MVFEKKHPVDELFSHMIGFGPETKGKVCAIEKRIAGTAFFPGGDGLWKDGNREPTRPDIPDEWIMVLGKDFGKESDFEKACNRGDELNIPTWKTLQHISSAVGFSLQQCFFTNIYMGLRVNCKSNCKSYPLKAQSDFCRKCIEFLNLQIETIAPRIIVTLGNDAIFSLASLSPELFEWKKTKRLKEIVCTRRFCTEASFSGLKRKICVLPLVHPSFWLPNLARFFGSNGDGDQIEIARMKECFDSAGLAHMLKSDPQKQPRLPIACVSHTL